jgi:phasin family protein
MFPNTFPMMPDMTKLFDPQAMTNAMQSMWNVQSASAYSKQQVDAMKKLSTLMTDTFSTCSEKQLKYVQSSMEDCIEAMRELATAKGIEEYMQKSAQLSQKNAEKCQSMAQDLSSQWQKSQTQCSELITKSMQQGMEAAKAWQASSSK